MYKRENAMNIPSTSAGIPILLSRTNIIVTAAKEEQLCPDGKLYPDGGAIGGITSGLTINGLGRQTIFLSPTSPTKAPIKSAHITITPVALVLRKHSIIIAANTQIPPSSPIMLRYFITKSRKPHLNVLWMKFSIEKSIEVINSKKFVKSPLVYN